MMNNNGELPETAATIPATVNEHTPSTATDIAATGVAATDTAANDITADDTAATDIATVFDDLAEDAVARSPMPESPVPGVPLMTADPELYAAWRDHMRRGFENNQVMFEQVLTGFMNPYWTTVWMYRILFGVGVSAFVVAALLALLGRGAATAGLFGGLSVAAFLGYFLNRPLQALEENLQFITWLGVIYNSYWTRLAYTSDLTTVQQEIEAATDATIAQIKELMDKHTERNSSRPTIAR